MLETYPITLHIFTGSSAQSISRTVRADSSVAALVAQLASEGLFINDGRIACLVMHGTRMLLVEQTLYEVFASLPEEDRQLTILVVPVQARWGILQLFHEMMAGRFTPGFGYETTITPPIDLLIAEMDQPIPTLDDEAEDFDAMLGDVAEEEEDRSIDLELRGPAPTEAPPPPAPTGPPPAQTRQDAPAPLPRAMPTSAPPSRPSESVSAARARASDDEDAPPSRRKQRKEDSALFQEKPSTAARRLTVRYYDRMNPEHVFPLIVTLTEKEVAKIVQKHVAQEATGPFQVKLDQFVEVEPILPGCTCHPAKQSLKLGAKDAVLTFWVVPHVLGKVKGAVVAVRQDGVVLAEVALNIKVKKKTAAVVMGCVSLALPFVSSAAKRFGIDFEKEGSFDIYLSILNTLFRQIPPTALFGVAALITLLLWWLSRPRKRDMFWDMQKVSG